MNISIAGLVTEEREKYRPSKRVCRPANCPGWQRATV
jgi:hypothetical protein